MERILIVCWYKSTKETAEIPIVIHYTYVFDVIKIRYKILIYPRTIAKNEAQLRDCVVMHLLLKSGLPSDS